MEGTLRLIALAVLVATPGCTMIGSPELSGRPTTAERPRPGPIRGGQPAERSGDEPGRPTPAPRAPKGTPADAIEDAVPRADPPSRSGNRAEYKQSGATYKVLETSEGYDERGIASWYGEPFHGRLTSSGETYDMYAMTAAHRSLPLPSYVEVTNLANGRKAVLRVNDRGPFHEPKRRIIDVSYSAAVKLGLLGTGTAPVRVRSVGPVQTRNRPGPGGAARGRR